MDDDLSVEIEFADLYLDSFDPVMSNAELKRRTSFDGLVQKYSRKLEECTMLVIVHPNWWNAPPAILKGFIDRVFRTGVAYDFKGADFEKKQHKPALSGKRMYVVSVSDLDDDTLIHDFWKNVSEYSGMDFEFTGIKGMRDLGHTQRQQHIESVTTYIREHI